VCVDGARRRLSFGGGGSGGTAHVLQRRRGLQKKGMRGVLASVVVFIARASVNFRNNYYSRANRKINK